MSEQHNVEHVRNAYEAFGRGDIAAVAAACDPSVVWTIPGPSIVPTFGTRNGREGVMEFFQTLARDQDVLAFEPKRFVAQRDTVVVFGFYAWRVKATGLEAASEYAHEFTLRDGLVTKFQEYTNTAAFADAYRSAASV